MDGYGAAPAGNQNYAEALEFFDAQAKNLTGNEPADRYVDLHTIRAKTLDMLGRNGDAVRCLDDTRDWLEKTAPENGKAWDFLMVSYDDAGEADKARSCRGARSGGTIRGYSGRVAEGFIDARKHYVRGTVLAAALDRARAAACFERAIKADPSMVVAHYSLGLVRREMGMYADALACFFRTILADPTFAPPYADMAMEIKRAGNKPVALKCVDRALRLDPNLDAAILSKGLILADMGRHQEAISYFDRTLAAGHDRAAVHIQKGLSMTALGRDGDSIKCFERAHELDPHYMTRLVDANAMVLKRMREAGRR